MSAWKRAPWKKPVLSENIWPQLLGHLDHRLTLLEQVNRRSSYFSKTHFLQFLRMNCPIHWEMFPFKNNSFLPLNYGRAHSLSKYTPPLKDLPLAVQRRRNKTKRNSLFSCLLSFRQSIFTFPSLNLPFSPSVRHSRSFKNLHIPGLSKKNTHTHTR